MIGFRLPNGQQIDLSPGATISLEINNALLAESDNNGSYTLPVTAPRTDSNELALRFAGLLDSPSGSTRRIENVQAFDDDELLAVGTLLLLRITPISFELSLQTGISAVMTKLKSRKLRDFVFGGQRPVAASLLTMREGIEAHMNAVAAQPQDYDYVFAPVSNNDVIADNPEGFPRRVNFNLWSLNYPPLLPSGFTWSTGYFAPANTVPGLQVQLFPGYYPAYQYSCVPFPKLAYVIRTMLREMNIPFEEDFFDAETEELAIIGNTPIDDLRTNSEARTLDYTQVGLTFRIGDVLPDITAHELLRAVADDFYLDLSISPIGELRLRRSNTLLSLPPATSLTAQATPTYVVDVPAEAPPGLATAYRIEHDTYVGTQYQVVDPQMRNEDVATRAALPTQPEFDHEIRLVLDERVFYQHDGTEWKLFSVELPTVTVGPANDQATQVPQGTELVLDREMPSEQLLPLPGAEWPPLAGISPPPNAGISACVFGERGYSPTVNGRTRTKAVRLGFYRGMQPFKDATQGFFPMLSQLNTDLQGGRLGNYTLLLDGADGTVAQWGRPILEARRAGEVVTWPVWLTPEQINQLDLGRRHEINGIHFMVKKINVTFPIRKPAELQLVVIRPKATLE